MAGDFVKYYIDDQNFQIKNNAEKYVAFCESEYSTRVEEIAKSIRNNAHTAPVVLLSGPSGSGKTTTAMRLEQLLDSWGHKAHTLSLDNYFRELSEEELRLSKEGKLDLESPNRLDKAYLNEQIRKIVKMESVDIPRYNFVTCKREFSGWTLTRKKGEIIIFEGTHALNPDVITVPDEKCARLYVSIRSQFVSDDTELRSKTIRLLRRILRDTKTRDRDPNETLNMFESVNKGEDEHIRPFMKRCNYSIDTLIPYEINIYKSLLSDTLEQLPQTQDVQKLKWMLEKAQPLDESLVPKDSLVREFIGNSSLKY